MSEKRNSAISTMSAEEKQFFRQLLDIIKRYHCQREALMQILTESCENWEPVFHVLKDDTQIVRKADELFSEMYRSIDSGKRDSAPLSKFSKALPVKARPN